MAFALLNTIGMTVLFGTEIGFVAVALDWAIAGLLHLGTAVTMAIGTVPAAAALVATAWIARRTWLYETGRS